MTANGTFDEARFRATVPTDIPKQKVDSIVQKCGRLSKNYSYLFIVIYLIKKNNIIVHFFIIIAQPVPTCARLEENSWNVISSRRPYTSSNNHRQLRLP